MKLNKLMADTFGQMIESDNITNSFSPGLKKSINKIGVATLTAALLVVGSGMVNDAKANDLNKLMIGAAVVTGMATNGSNNVQGQAINCDEASKNGWKIGGSTAIGAAIGSQVGGGSGTKVATVLGGLLGGVIANNSEEQRIMEACNNKVMSGNNNQVAHEVGGIPKYASRTSYVNSPIIYEGRTVDGRSFYVTAKDSPGLAALKSNRNAVYSVDNDPIVRNALDKATENLVYSYTILDETAKTYKEIVSGNTTVGKLSRYAVEDMDVSASSQVQRTNQNKIYEIKQRLDEAFQDYAKRRAVMGNVLDNAAVDRYDITPYADVATYFNPPASLSVRYERGAIPNKYAVIPGMGRP